MNPDDIECGAITSTPDGARQRCVQKPVDHRGPHWSNTEVITCSCKHFCAGHKEIFDHPHRRCLNLKDGSWVYNSGELHEGRPMFKVCTEPHEEIR